jgi:hypothetical protein
MARDRDTPYSVIPAKAGIHLGRLDPRLREGDEPYSDIEPGSNALAIVRPHDCF